MAETATRRIGLRFNRGDAKQLRDIGDQLARTDTMRDHAGLFHQAAEAAAGPDGLLIVVCTNPLEAILMAHAFPRFGVSAPTVEELSQ